MPHVVIEQAGPLEVVPLVEALHHSIAMRLGVVRGELAVVECGDAVAASNDLLRRPESGLLLAGRIGVRGRAVVDQQKHRHDTRWPVRQKKRELESMRS